MTKPKKKVEVKYVTDEELDELELVIYRRFQTERRRGFSGRRLA